MACSPALRDDLGHLVNLSLRTAEGPKSLLGKLARTLVLAVTEKFDDTALVRGETEAQYSQYACRPSTHERRL